MIPVNLSHQIIPVVAYVNDESGERQRLKVVDSETTSTRYTVTSCLWMQKLRSYRAQVLTVVSF
jgi:hypothetical protein